MKNIFKKAGKVIASPEAPKVLIQHSPNPMITGVILFGSMVGGIAGARAAGRWFDRVAPKMANRISVTMAHVDAAINPDDDDEDDE